MNILGISSLDNMASATLLADGRLVASISEERLTRVKLQAGFPTRAIREVLRIAGLKEGEIDVVTYPFFEWKREAATFWRGYVRNLLEEVRDDVAGPSSRVQHVLRYGKWCIDCTFLHSRTGHELERELRRRSWWHKLERVEHHQAHAASAYLHAGVEQALILTLDWYGGGLAGSIGIGRPSGITRLKDLHFPHSLGMFYAYVTAALGFKPARHEGKIVGLAAYGDPAKLYGEVRRRLSLVDGGLRFHAGADLEFVRRLAREHRREDVAATFQRVLEDVVRNLVAYWIGKTGLKSVVLAGGVAANVKMNQRVHEVPGVEHVFIQPAMGDEGTGTGGALDFAFRRGLIRPAPLEHVYLGPEYSEAEMKQALQSAGFSPSRPEHVAEEIAVQLEQGKVVAHFNGRMEFGPRSLGNRSILCSAQDPSINQWLNDRLERTEFMPFAPLTNIEDSDRCYVNLNGALHTARFMTITCDCTEEMRHQSPAAVHVDGTARPQLVDKRFNPRVYDILDAYKRRTGIPSLINTSFNMHEEPIVCTPEDAIRAFKLGRLDVLIMGPWMVAQDQRDFPGRQAA